MIRFEPQMAHREDSDESAAVYRFVKAGPATATPEQLWRDEVFEDMDSGPVWNYSGHQEGDEAVLVDGMPVALPALVVKGIAGAIDISRRMRREGYLYEDCSAFAVTVADGTYDAVSDWEYTQQLGRTITYGPALSDAEITAGAEQDEMQLMQFGFTNAAGDFIPLHTAVRLPGHNNIYLHKIGPHSPIVISGSGEIKALFPGCDTVRQIHSFRAQKIWQQETDDAVLSYTNPTPATPADLVFRSVPDDWQQGTRDPYDW